MSKIEILSVLDECGTGIDMGVSAIDDVKDKVENVELYKLLERSRETHVALGDEIQALLAQCGETVKQAPGMAKTMSSMKTSMKLSSGDSDEKAAKIISEGCDMGVRSLSGYLNEFEMAEGRPRDIANRLIALETQLSKDLRTSM